MKRGLVAAPALIIALCVATLAFGKGTGIVLQPVGAGTLNCFPSPGSCGFPDPAVNNVGLPSGTSLTPSGSKSISTSVEGLEVNGTLTVTANNVHIKNSIITQKGTTPLVLGSTTGTVIERSTIRGEGVGGTASVEAAITGSGGATLKGAYLYNCNECVQVYPTTLTVEDSYLISNGENGGSHTEDIYSNNGTVVVKHSTLLNPLEQTATVFDDTEFGVHKHACVNHVTVEKSLLGGGGEGLYPCGNSEKIGTSAMTIKEDDFARCLGTPLTKQGSGGETCGVTDKSGSDTHGYWPYGGYFNLVGNPFFAKKSTLRTVPPPPLRHGPATTGTTTGNP